MKRQKAYRVTRRDEIPERPRRFLCYRPMSNDVSILERFFGRIAR